MGLSPTPGEGGGGGFPLPPLPPPVMGGGGGVSAPAVNSALGSVISYIGSVLGYSNSFASGLASSLAKAVKAIAGEILALWHQLQQTWLGQILKSVWHTVKTIWDAVQNEITHLIKLFRWYEQLVRYWEQRIFGPVLNIIQALRKTLVLFKVFHIKLAARLDNYLSGIEGRLANILLFYQRQLNQIIDWLNLIVDPFGLISEGMFIGSAVRSIGAVWASVMGYPKTGSTTALNKASATSTNFYTKASTVTYMKGLAAGGTNPDDQAIIESQRQGFAELGYKV